MLPEKMKNGESAKARVRMLEILAPSQRFSKWKVRIIVIAPKKMDIKRSETSVFPKMNDQIFSKTQKQGSCPVVKARLQVSPRSPRMM